MQTILLDGSRYTSPREIHTALRNMLQLPSWYGMNADALNDCLSELRETVSLWVVPSENEELNHTLQLISQVVEDNGGSVREL